jgi:hypothetical protein
MTTFLNAVGTKLADRWLALVVLPGALFIATAGVALLLGQSHWHDVTLLRRPADEILVQPTGQGALVIVLALIGLAAGSSVVGLLVRALGAGLERLLLIEASNPVTRRLAARRRRRWQAANDAFEAALLDAGRATVTGADDTRDKVSEAERRNAVRNRIALTTPMRPFWYGDRFSSVDRRVLDAYQLDLASAWPRLWLVLPDAVRNELHAARTEWTTAVRSVVWGFAYVLLGALWWPAALIGIGTAAVGLRRCRVTAAAFTDVVEATVDTHGRTLAVQLGIECAGQLTAEVGAAVTELLRKKI